MEGYVTSIPAAPPGAPFRPPDTPDARLRLKGSSTCPGTTAPPLTDRRRVLLDGVAHQCLLAAGRAARREAARVAVVRAPADAGMPRSVTPGNRKGREGGTWRGNGGPAGGVRQTGHAFRRGLVAGLRLNAPSLASIPWATFAAMMSTCGPNQRIICSCGTNERAGLELVGCADVFTTLLSDPRGSSCRPPLSGAGPHLHHRNPRPTHPPQESRTHTSTTGIPDPHLHHRNPGPTPPPQESQTHTSTTGIPAWPALDSFLCMTLTWGCNGGIAHDDHVGVQENAE